MGLWINTTDTLNQHIVSLRETASVAPLILENSLANVSLLCYAMLSHFSRVRLCVTP